MDLNSHTVLETLGMFGIEDLVQTLSFLNLAGIQK